MASGTKCAHVDYHVAAEGYGGNVGFLLEKESDIEDVLSMARTAALQCRGPVLINAMLSSSDFREGSISL
ncbi:hypothetical protein Pmar_PMAR000518 [Perkinsus marinus ATCC 50983]|uniref:Uncharacterized protein n=1 Tax=Perkinsus marinus (strain ATCC 50983 / TXsc) TaxID=423536 RepID=C5L4U6_PERM5|nr:hypothetical protein Pmar_PMAR000518 [Perkinsus marinus ATCC 50983]EER08247.1 hypothetical protein Pmar_PMAR000518 [Perkinsus marinus ATCC 50983]|eukprot:XP_002776431.1 hypothetical protein Pmar_PMAR000518 [Perkinsus marinus ATCC 50983]